MHEKFSDLYRLSEAVREKRLIVKEIKTAGSSRKVNKIQFNNDFKNISCNSKSLSCITRKPILLNTMANLLFNQFVSNTKIYNPLSNNSRIKLLLRKKLARYVS